MFSGFLRQFSNQIADAEFFFLMLLLYRVQSLTQPVLLGSMVLYKGNSIAQFIDQNTRMFFGHSKSVKTHLVLFYFSNLLPLVDTVVSHYLILSFTIVLSFFINEILSMSYDVSIQYIISDIFQKHDNYFNSKKETCKIMICSLLGRQV